MAKTKSNLHRDVHRARNRRDADILRRASRGETHESIANTLGMTRQRVGQIIKAAQPKDEA